MNNDFEFREDYVVIFLDRKDGSRLETLIDIEDFELVMNAPFKWSPNKSENRKNCYVIGRSKRYDGGKRDNYQLHRWILNASKETDVDHIFHNTLDNRRYNLRALPKGKNNQNQPSVYPHSKTKIRGVDWSKKSNKWRSRYCVNGVRYVIGYYDDINEAEKAVIEARANYMPYSLEAYCKNIAG